MSTATAVRERPILFSAPMVRAILEGRKTQARRVVKPQPIDGHRLKLENGEWWPHYMTPLGEMVWTAGGPVRCPYGEIGDRLWVRESAYIAPPNFGDDDLNTHTDNRGRGRCVAYIATMDAEGVRCATDYGIKQTPSIHMPRWASRITLEITDVRVQRIQDITNDDIRAEGVGYPIGEPLVYGSVTERWNRDREFAPLWDQTNGKGSWTANKWVWAITFKRLTEEPAK